MEIRAQSCASADVRAAMQQAQAGDTVAVPAGTAKWTEQVKWSPPADCHLKFEGSVIVDNYKPSTDIYHTAGYLLEIATSGNPFRMSGFTLVGDKDNSNYKYGIIGIIGGSKSFRADHFRINLENGYFPDFNYAVPSGFEFWGQPYGVMDHCELNLVDRGAFYVLHGDGEGDDAWAKDAGFGGPDFLFIEDWKITNHGNGGVVNDSYHGGKWVVRHGHAQGASIGQTHPTGGSGRARGARAWESYNVTTERGVNGKEQFNAYYIQSGSGVIFGVKAGSNYSNLITMHSKRASPPGTSYPQWAPPDGWGYYPSVYDANGGAIDQPGRGRGDLLVNPFPNVKNAATGADSSSPAINPRQTIEGVYEWDNEFTTAGGGLKIANYNGNVLIEGRDYFQDTPKPGYTPYVYPHPLVSGEPAPIPPNPIPPDPPNPEPPDPPIPPDPEPPIPPIPPDPPNGAPTVAITQPVDGQVITGKNYSITMDVQDDTGAAWLSLYINGAMANGFPRQGNQTAKYTTTYSWNTNPYKGKGPVEIKAEVVDADGAKGTSTVTVTVKK